MMHSNPPSKNVNGFTLVELLIAISILSMLLATATYSYSIVAAKWEKVLNNFSESAARTKHIDFAYQIIAGIQSYVVKDSTGKPAFFFVGHEDRLLATTYHGIFSDAPEIFRLSALEKENGKFDLVYQSLSTDEVFITTSDQEVSFETATVLLTDLDSVQFEYFGWRHVYEKTDDEGNGYKPVWQESYSGITARYMPSKISLILVKNELPLKFVVDLQTDVETWLSPYSDSDT